MFDELDDDAIDDQNGELGPMWTYRGYHLGPENFASAMVHLYRAEITRVNLWRNRLDTTTNWAVVTTAGALTFCFSDPQNPHFVLLLVLLLVLIFLNIEARRYGYYSLWYQRARTLEVEFFAAMIATPFKPTSDWGNLLSKMLTKPTIPITRWESLGNRYRRNYIWIISIIILSWILKLSVHPQPLNSLQKILARAAIGEILSSEIVVAMVATIYVGLFILAGWGWLHYKRPKRQKFSQPRRKPKQTRNKDVHLAVVITDHKEEVATRLMEELGRGVTALEGTGMYTGAARNVLMCGITSTQVEALNTIVSDIDDGAFVIVTEASDIRGRGFGAIDEPPS